MAAEDVHEWALRLLQTESRDIENDQRSAYAQLLDLHAVALMLKMYDAADWLRDEIEASRAR